MENFNSELYCQEKAVSSGSSFYYSFLFLTPQQRKAIHALYAFCRQVDDIVDECSDAGVAKIKLEWWRKEIERVFLGTPQHPIGRALAEVQQHTPLQKTLFLEIIQGMEMDLKFQGYQTFDDLRLYCHCVASCVGLLAAEIFGYQDPRTLEYARELGLAFQLVNIIRDVGEDALRGRIYLPEEELQQFQVTSQSILKREYSENFRLLMQFQATRARHYYQNAKNSLPAGDRLAQASGLIMADIYFVLLKEIEKTNFKVLSQRIALTPLRKFWIAWRSYRNIKKGLMV